jgi:hypothetical protein
VKAERQRSRTATVGQKTEITNPHEPVWEQMQQEAAQEFIEPKSQQFLLVVMSRIAPAESDLIIR